MGAPASSPERTDPLFDSIRRRSIAEHTERLLHAASVAEKTIAERRWESRRRELRYGGRESHGQRVHFTSLEERVSISATVHAERVAVSMDHCRRVQECYLLWWLLLLTRIHFGRSFLIMGSEVLRGDCDKSTLRFSQKLLPYDL